MTLPDAYAVAVRELPVTAGPVASGAVSVVHGAAWIDEAAGATAAAVVVVAGQPAASPAELRRLRNAGGPPVVLERERLRRDLVDDALAGRAGAPVRLVLAECTAASGDVPFAVRDAVGWSRELVGPLDFMAGHADGKAASALLLARANGVPVVLRVTVARVERSFVRVTAVGEVTTDVVVDDLGGHRSVTTLSREGAVRAPTRWETVERLTLRRALAAVDTGQPGDLAELLHDTELAERVLDTAGSVLLEP